MGIVSEASKQQIRDRVPLEELVREYNVHLVPSGRRLKGLCPFHAEKTPSFSIDVEKQYFYCFGCHAGGDLFSFVKVIHHVDYPEALEILARRAGVVLQYVDGRGAARGAHGVDRESLSAVYDSLELAQDYYHRYLLQDPAARPAREYLKRRGIEPATWERFRLGYSPPEWDSFLRVATKRGALANVLEKAGLVRRRGAASAASSSLSIQAGESLAPPLAGRGIGGEGGGFFDYFRGRLMFPIQDPQCRVIGFGARTLGDDQPKYLNTPKTPVFEKSQVLYALPLARAGIQREGRIAIVEGYTDAILAHQAGLDFFVASLGTAFTQENARRLGRLAPKVLLIFDGDDAGQKASERSLDLLVSESLDVRVYTVKDGKDPCDAIHSLGGEEFRRRFEAGSVGLFEFKWMRTMESGGAGGAAPALRARALDEFLALLARVPNVVARKLYLREFAERLRIPEESIETRLREITRRGTRAHRGGSSGVSPPHSGNLPPRSGTFPPRSPQGDGQGDGGSAGVLGAANGPGQAAVGGGEAQGWQGHKNSELAEVVLECILALPGRAPAIWSQVPRRLFEGPVLRRLADLIERQLQAGDFSIPGLVRGLSRDVEDAEAGQVLSSMLSRLEDDDGNPVCDYEEVWTRVQRDLGRYVRRTRLEELRQLMAAEGSKGEDSSFASLRREYFETLRELKK